MELDDLVQCQRCNSKILKKCQAIHHIACKNNKTFQPRQQKNFFQKLFSSSKQQQEYLEQQQENLDLIPCTQCGQSFPFKIYAEHMNQCVGHQLTKCQQCRILFPTFLFQEHLQVCLGENVQNFQEQQYAQNNPLHALITNLAQQQLNEKQLNENPLSQLQISSLKLIKAKKQQDCAICCCLMKPASAQVQLYCKHVFHKACISSWLKKNPRCPMCRTHALKFK